LNLFNRKPLKRDLALHTPQHSTQEKEKRTSIQALRHRQNEKNVVLKLLKQSLQEGIEPFSEPHVFAQEEQACRRAHSGLLSLFTRRTTKQRALLSLWSRPNPLSHDAISLPQARTTKENESDAARPNRNLMASKTWHSKKATRIDIGEEENSVTLALGCDPSNTATEKADENSGTDQNHGAGRSFAFGLLLGQRNHGITEIPSYLEREQQKTKKGFPRVQNRS